MPKTVSSAELRKMSAQDLQKEIMEKRLEVSKMKLGVEQRSHKDTAQFRRERKHLARLLTIEKEVANAGLKEMPKATKMPASTKAPKAKKSSSSSK
jgi:ribosomal protein L29